MTPIALNIICVYSIYIIQNIIEAQYDLLSLLRLAVRSALYIIISGFIKFPLNTPCIIAPWYSLCSQDSVYWNVEC